MHIVIAAAGALLAQPCAAADFAAHEPAGVRSSAFAGATLRIGLDRHRPEAARPRLAIGITRVSERLGGDGRVDRWAMPGLELGFAGSGRPRLMIGGESLPEARQRLGLTTGQAVLGIVGLSVVAFAAGELLGSDEQEDELDKVQCLLPEGCPLN